MATITFYKTTLDGENYPDFLEEYLEGCEKKEVTVKAVSPGRESYTIALNDLLPAGMNYAKIEQVRAAFFYKVENLLAPVGDTSYPYVLTLDKFATAAFNATLTQSGTGTLLEFNAKNFYGDGTAAIGIGQAPVDSAVDMSKLGKNALGWDGNNNGVFPLVFITIDGSLRLMVPDDRMTEAYPQGYSPALAYSFAGEVVNIAREGKFLQWEQTASGWVSNEITKVKVVSLYFIPATVFYGVGIGQITYAAGYGYPGEQRYVATPPSPLSYLTNGNALRLALEITGDFQQLAMIPANVAAFFGGASQQIQTLPNGKPRKIQAALRATGDLSLLMRDESGGYIDCSGACRWPLLLPTETKTEEALSKAATVLSTGVSVIGVAGSAATGNPLGIAASAGGLASNVLGAVRQFSAPQPTSTTSGSSFIDLNGGWAPVFVNTAPLARKIDEYGYTPARFLDWNTAPKVPTQHHPVFFHGTVSGAETLLPESWLNDGFSSGVRVWLKSELDNRAEILKL